MQCTAATQGNCGPPLCSEFSWQGNKCVIAENASGQKEAWLSLGMSRDGKRAVAATMTGRLFLSANGGVTWSDISSFYPELSGSSNSGGKYAAISGDGTKLIVVSQKGDVLVSDNFGSTWMSRGRIPFDTRHNIHGISASENLMNIAAISNYIYMSSDGGISWEEPGKDHGYIDISMSQDGMKIIAIGGGGPPPWEPPAVTFSSDGGVTWVESSIVPKGKDYSWNAAAVSGDGNVFIIGEAEWPLLSSVDGGHSWKELSKVTGQWMDITMSMDGSKIAAVSLNDQIYVSNDKGITWVGRGEKRAWRVVTSTPDGRKLLATDGSSKIYVSNDSGQTWS